MLGHYYNLCKDRIVTFIVATRYRYSITVAMCIVGVFTLLRLYILGNSDVHDAFITYYPAVMLAALYGGLASGLFATIFSTFSADWLFIPRDGSYWPVKLDDTLSILIFVISCSMISAITETMHSANKKAKRNQQRLSLALEASQLGDWELSLDTLLAQRSVRHDQIFGYTDLQPRWSFPVFLSHVHPSDRVKVEDSFVESVATGKDWNFECRIIKVDKSEGWIWASGKVHKDKNTNRSYMVGMLGDLTERKEAEMTVQHLRHELEESLVQRAEDKIAEQAELLNGARDAICVQDVNGYVLFWNQGAEKLYGWTKEEAIGKNISTLIYPDFAKYETISSKVLEDGVWVGEVIQKTKQGLELTIDARLTLLKNKKGESKSILTINTDITEKKQLESQFLRAQRMESIGTLAGGIAHDLNNILTPIMLCIESLKASTSDPSSLQLLANIELSSKRGSDIVRQVLSFARGLEGTRTELRPEEIIKDMELIIRETFPKSIELNIGTSSSVWPIYCNATQLHQILLNLCVNSRDAMPDGGTLDLSVGNITDEELQYVANKETEHYVVFSVRDTGVGIPSSIKDKIFEPFFTTKEVSKGTGLGLSTVQAIVKSHNGLIAVISNPGQGTTFKIFIPARTAPSHPRASQNLTSTPRGNGELILLIDDEASVLAVTQHTLEAFGYRVLVANHGAEGLATYKQNQTEIDLVITDMSMPIMDGNATIEALLYINPKVKIILASGFHGNGQDSLSATPKVKYRLTKPYTAKTLLNTVKSILAAN